MALPTPEKTWAIDPCNLVAYSSQTQVLGDTFLAIKNSLLTMSGVTVKGSSNGTAGGMDGVDRWVTSADVQTRGSSSTTPMSWIVLDLANMGGAELLIAHTSAVGRVAINLSPGGLYAAAGTATHKPTATDEMTTAVSGGEFVNLYDHRWTTWLASDGSALYFGIASRGVWQGLVGVQLVRSVIAEGAATFSPAVAIVRFSTSTGSGSLATHVWVRINSVNELCALEPEPLSSSALGISDLQGGTNYILPVYFAATTVGIRGVVGVFRDIWAGNDAAADGDTYPLDGTRLFIQVWKMILPWDGSLVLMT